MGLQPDERPGGGQFAAETEADERNVEDGTRARPMFTPARKDAADDMVPDDIAGQATTVAEDYPDDEMDEEAFLDEEAPLDEAHEEARVAAPAEPVTPVTPVTAVPAAAGTAPAPVASSGLDQPLPGGEDELLAQWQRVQARFVDDPQVAVASAADLVEEAGQALVDALRQRQRQMRSMWDLQSAGGPGDITADTEQLRLIMQGYRALFNQLHQAV